MLRIKALGAISVLSLCLSACPGGDGPDGGTSSGHDAGRVSTDSGLGDDAGAPARDAGTVRDAGNASVDAGTPPHDAGNTGYDAGNPGGGPDAGAPADAGGPVGNFDAGTITTDYWDSVDLAQSGQALVLALNARMSATHVRTGYDDLFDEYEFLGGGQPGCNGIFDIYSSKCWQPSERCGQYSAEGQCYNREHTWPKSWWEGPGSGDANSDVFAVLPSDGYINGLRGSLPFGEVDNANYTSTNGTKRGDCADTSGDCVEPADSLKGDIARIYFYMAVRYEGDFSCCDTAATDGPDIDQWQEATLRAWHNGDDVDDGERIRHERGFMLQQNRNPFVDFPDMVDFISDF